MKFTDMHPTSWVLLCRSRCNILKTWTPYVFMCVYNIYLIMHVYMCIFHVASKKHVVYMYMLVSHMIYIYIERERENGFNSK